LFAGFAYGVDYFGQIGCWPSMGRTCRCLICCACSPPAARSWTVTASPIGRCPLSRFGRTVPGRCGAWRVRRRGQGDLNQHRRDPNQSNVILISGLHRTQELSRVSNRATVVRGATMRKTSIAGAALFSLSLATIALAQGGGGGGGGSSSGGSAGGAAGSSASGSVGGAGAPGSAGAPSAGLGAAPGIGAQLGASPGAVGQVASPNNVAGQPGTTQPSSGTTAAAGTPGVASGTAPGVAAGNGSPTAPSTGGGPIAGAGVAADMVSGAQGVNPNNTTAQPGTTQPSSGVPLNGKATLNAEKKLGVAEPSSEEKSKNDQLLDQANRSIQRTQKETTTTPSGTPVVR
jgi:hypothetical protein